MSPSPRSVSAPGPLMMVCESWREARRKLMRAGKLFLIIPVMTSVDGPLRRDHEVDAGRARLLGEAGERDLHLARRGHHEVGELVDDHHDVRQLLRSFFVARRHRVGRRRPWDPRTRGSPRTGSAGTPRRLGAAPARRPPPRSRPRPRPRPRACGAAARPFVLEGAPLGAELLDLAVVALQVLRAGVGEDLGAALHLVHRPLERARPSAGR